MKPLLLENLILFDGASPTPYQADILIKGERFVFVSPEKRYSASEEVDALDLSGFFALPGLIDCHVHLVSPVEAMVHEPYWKLNTPPPLKALCAACNALETLRPASRPSETAGESLTGFPRTSFCAGRSTPATSSAPGFSPAAEASA